LDIAFLRLKYKASPIMPIDITKEIKYKTARSGGKGGQNVNKVETMVEGFWHVDSSQLIDESEKIRLHLKLKNHISQEGFFIAKCQEERSQLANKLTLTVKMNVLVNKALLVPKKRKATKPTAASKMQRLESKKIASTKKETRKKINTKDA